MPFKNTEHLRHATIPVAGAETRGSVRVRSGLIYSKHLVVDVDLKSFFDDIRHDRMLEKMARRIEDGEVLALLKQFLKSTGGKGIPQGSPLSPLMGRT
jgi:RNA-directed DNA polymerase